MLGRDERTDARAFLARIADRHGAGRSAKPILKIVSDRGVHEDPRTRQADLPRVQVLSGGGLRGRIKVGVGAYDVGRLAAELETDGSERARGGLPDQLRGVGPAGEAQ